MKFSCNRTVGKLVHRNFSTDRDHDCNTDSYWFVPLARIFSLHASLDVHYLDIDFERTKSKCTN